MANPLKSNALFTSLCAFVGRLLLMALMAANVHAKEHNLTREDYEWMLGSKLPLFDAAYELFSRYNDSTGRQIISASSLEIQSVFRKHLNGEIVSVQKITSPCGEFKSVGWVITAQGNTKVGLRQAGNNTLQHLAIGWSPSEPNDTRWFCHGWYSLENLKPFKPFFLTSFREYDENALALLAAQGIHYDKNWTIREEYRKESPSPLDIAIRNPRFKTLEEIYQSEQFLPKGFTFDKIKSLAVSPRIPIAVFDTGVDYNHPSVAYKVSRLPEQTGWDFVENDQRPFDFGRTFFMGDKISHGTAVASIAAGDGILTSAIPIRLIGIDATKELSRQFLRAVELTKKAGARVVNISYDFDITRRDSARAELVAEFNSNAAKVLTQENKNIKKEFAKTVEIMKQNPQILFVLAAGNLDKDSSLRARDSDNLFTTYLNPNTTIRLPNVLVVGSTKKDHKVSDFSMYGKKSVHVAAFGDATNLPISDNKTREMMGTSFAAPYVAHGAAYILAKRPHYTTTQVVETLKKSVVQSGDLKEKFIWGGYFELSNLKKLLD